MKFGRYKDKDWQKAHRASRRRLRVFLSHDGADVVAAWEAQLMLKAHYRGPWMMILAMLNREIRSWFGHYCWPTWNWIRVKVFRGAQDETIAAFEAEQQKDLIKL